MRKLCSFLVKLSGLVFVFLVWQIVTSCDLLEPTLFPSPLQAFSAFANLFVHSSLLREIIYTLQRVFSGFLIAAVFGVFLGLIIGAKESLSKSLEGVIDFFRSIPVVTLYPIFILLFGINDEAKIAMTFWATFWIISFNTIYGVRQTSKIRREVANIYGASKTQIFRWITFFEALPQILVGMRIAISCALLAEIMCEMFMGSDFGIGQKIYEYNVRLSAPELYALVVTTGIIGIIINRVFILFEKIMIPWKTSYD